MYDDDLYEERILDVYIGICRLDREVINPILINITQFYTSRFSILLLNKQ